MTSIERKNFENSRQCCTCKYYVDMWLEQKNGKGIHSKDFGLCRNQKSDHWYHVIFEHHTCKHWQQAPDEML